MARPAAAEGKGKRIRIKNKMAYNGKKEKARLSLFLFGQMPIIMISIN